MNMQIQSLTSTKAHISKKQTNSISELQMGVHINIKTSLVMCYSHQKDKSKFIFHGKVKQGCSIFFFRYMFILYLRISLAYSYFLELLFSENAASTLDVLQVQEIYYNNKRY